MFWGEYSNGCNANHHRWHHNRRQYYRGRAAWRFYYERNTERRRINIALLAEIHRLLHDVIPRHWGWWESRRPPDDEKLPLIPFTTPIYDVHAKNIGYLNEDIVANAASFYGYIKFLNSLQASKDEYEKLGDLSGFSNTYESALETAFEVYKDEFQKTWTIVGIGCGKRCILELIKKRGITQKS